MIVCRNIQSNDLYLYIDDEHWKNLRTNKIGKVAPELAQKILKINVEATYFHKNYPEVFELLIKQLNLKSDK